jgi:adenylyl-sulfate kinase
MSIERQNCLHNPAHKGFMLWFTGLSGSGKSTLSERLSSQFKTAGYRVELLDGDEIRTHLSKGLGFSREDRDTNIRRIGFVARLLARNGVIAITAAISPYREIRDEIRSQAAMDGVPFVEVFVNATIHALVERDVKGLYKKAMAGEIPQFTGITDPYEPPLSPDIEVRTDNESIEESLETIRKILIERGFITR